jgi:hypothetical protein
VEELDWTGPHAPFMASGGVSLRMHLGWSSFCAIDAHGAEEMKRLMGINWVLPMRMGRLRNMDRLSSTLVLLFVFQWDLGRVTCLLR